MSDFGGRGQSSRSLINDFQLQSYGGEAAPLSGHAQSHVSEVEFSDIDLESDTSPAQQAKVVVVAVTEKTCVAVLLFACLEQLKLPSTDGPAFNNQSVCPGQASYHQQSCTGDCQGCFAGPCGHSGCSRLFRRRRFL